MWKKVINKKIVMNEKKVKKEKSIKNDKIKKERIEKKEIKEIKEIKNNMKNEDKNIVKNEVDEFDDNINKKKILCLNIIKSGVCKYGNKCLYAHNLNEQQISRNRKEAYEIIKSTKTLVDINLNERVDLYKTLIELTKYCKNCINNNCIGGYNCKSGVYDKKYCICVNDLKYNNCKNNNCNFIHLSKRGLHPFFYNDIENNIENNIQIVKKSEIDELSESLSFSNDENSDNENINEENKNDDIIKYINNICNMSIFCNY